ncbi:MAG: pilus assembly protein TadG-related protein [Planctomycetota bacterium]
MIQVFIALLLFAFFAFGGLIADLGFVRLTQRQMSNAADGAALEGLRLEDTLSDDERRDAARRRLQAHFDDDFGSTAGDAYQYGAGPYVTLQGGTTNMGANKQVVVDPGLVYKPDLELNETNEIHGDLVAGWYDEADATHAEDPAYQRSDFDTVADPDRREAFLVRVRRTTDDEGLDAQAGISSTGPVIPYLFARGSLMAGETREKGVSVRATTIAQARNATLAGPPHDAYGIPGYAPIALELDYWNGPPATEPDGTFVIQFGANTSGGGNPNPGPPLPNPNPTRGAPPIIPPGQLVGGGTTPNAVFADRLDDPQRRSWSIGDPVWVDVAPDIDRALALLGNPHLPGYTPRLFTVPLYEGDVLLFYDGRPGNSNPPFLPPVNNVPKDDMDPRIVGFGAIEVVRATINAGVGDDDEEDGQDHVLLFVRRLPATIFPTNLSAVAAPGLADLPRWLTDQLADLNATIDEPAKAAALGR